MYGVTVYGIKDRSGDNSLTYIGCGATGTVCVTHVDTIQKSHPPQGGVNRESVSPYHINMY